MGFPGQLLGRLTLSRFDSRFNWSLHLHGLWFVGICLGRQNIPGCFKPQGIFLKRKAYRFTDSQLVMSFFVSMALFSKAFSKFFIILNLLAQDRVLARQCSSSTYGYAIYRDTVYCTTQIENICRWFFQDRGSCSFKSFLVLHQWSISRLCGYCWIIPV